MEFKVFKWKVDVNITIEKFMPKNVKLELAKLIKLNNLSTLDMFDKDDWNMLSLNNLSEDFIHFFRNELNWTYLSGNYKMSEEFISKHSKYIDWNVLFTMRVLSEKFIIKNYKKSRWDVISTYTTMSPSFIRKFQKRLNWKKVSSNLKITDEIFDEFKDLFYWDIVSRRKDITNEQIDKWTGYLHKDLFDEYVKPILESEKKSQEDIKKRTVVINDLEPDLVEKFIGNMNISMVNEHTKNIVDSYKKKYYTEKEPNPHKLEEEKNHDEQTQDEKFVKDFYDGYIKDLTNIGEKLKDIYIKLYYDGNKDENND